MSSTTVQNKMIVGAAAVASVTLFGCDEKSVKQCDDYSTENACTSDECRWYPYNCVNKSIDLKNNEELCTLFDGTFIAATKDTCVSKCIGLTGTDCTDLTDICELDDEDVCQPVDVSINPIVCGDLTSEDACAVDECIFVPATDSDCVDPQTFECQAKSGVCEYVVDGKASDEKADEVCTFEEAVCADDFEMVSCAANTAANTDEDVCEAQGVDADPRPFDNTQQCSFATGTCTLNLEALKMDQELCESVGGIHSGNVAFCLDDATECTIDLSFDEYPTDDTVVENVSWYVTGQDGEDKLCSGTMSLIIQPSEMKNDEDEDEDEEACYNLTFGDSNSPDYGICTKFNVTATNLPTLYQTSEITACGAVQDADGASFCKLAEDSEGVRTCALVATPCADIDLETDVCPRVVGEELVCGGQDAVEFNCDLTGVETDEICLALNLPFGYCSAAPDGATYEVSKVCAHTAPTCNGEFAVSVHDETEM